MIAGMACVLVGFGVVWLAHRWREWRAWSRFKLQIRAEEYERRKRLDERLVAAQKAMIREITSTAVQRAKTRKGADTFN